jgi:hypothetical protein
MMNYWLNMDSATERRIARERRRFFRMTREQISIEMERYGYEFYADDPGWTKRDAWEEYVGIILQRVG